MVAKGASRMPFFDVTGQVSLADINARPVLALRTRFLLMASCACAAHEKAI